jgi:chorismate mutase
MADYTDNASRVGLSNSLPAALAEWMERERTERDCERAAEARADRLVALPPTRGEYEALDAEMVDLMRERADLVEQVATLRAEVELSRRVADECIVRLRECEYRLADVMAEHTGTVEANEDLQREREAVAKYVASVLDDWDAAVRGLPGSSVRRLPRLRDAGRGGPDALAAAAVMASE